ncbi:ferritin [Clostridium autoethanogenum]|uniref:Ferritin n=2 Tax=Clostridium TaxID=1485 RepID=A0A162L9G3_9CLOT|nr:MULTISPECIES: ferritin [Clostridium]OAA90536.1 Ferritin [Clostridium ljungdahlii]RMD02538.1 ferritin [Clostridium autoethanogenum]
MLSDKLIKAINDQINYEMYSANIYFSMQAYCDSLDLDGFSNFFKVQIEEENYHITKFYDFLKRTNARILIGSIDSPDNNYDSINDAFKKALAHEKKVTARIYNLMDLATEEKEHATASLLKWFIDEQIEEEDTFNKLVKKLDKISGNSAALYMLDTELQSRTFVPPVNANAN